MWCFNGLVFLATGYIADEQSSLTSLLSGFITKDMASSSAKFQLRPSALQPLEATFGSGRSTGNASLYSH